jgi:hypothetical protein
VAVLTGTGAIYPFWFAGLFGWILWSAAAGITLRLRGRLHPGEDA